MMQIAKRPIAIDGAFGRTVQKTREANKSQGSTIRCEVAGIALRNRQPACRNLVDDGFFQFDEIHLYNLNDWSTIFRHVRT
jgi:hypothetical protein